MRFSLFATLASLALSQAATFNGINDEWSFDVNMGQHADWMGTISDDRPLSTLVIPGTHNSATNSLTSKLMQTQNVPLQQQLTGGIRYIDITCKLHQHELVVYHGVSKTESTFGKVLTTLFDFLDQHQTETVILRVQMGGLFKSAKSFAEAFERYFSTDISIRVASHVYSNGDNGITTAPTLGELRGKVLILEDFKAKTPGRYGLPWNEDTVSSYSRKFSASTFAMDSKWSDIESHLKETPSDSSNKLRITHTTASVGVSPINFAARNAPEIGMNKYLGQYLMYQWGRCYGIIAMDFPGQDLVAEILLLNDEYWAAQRATQSHDQGEMSAAVIDVTSV